MHGTQTYCIKFICCIIAVFIGASLSGQSGYIISGTLPIQYEGCDIYLGSTDSNFTAVQTKSRSGTFLLSGQLSGQFNRVYIAVRRDRNNLAEWELYIKADTMRLDILRLSKYGDRDAIRYVNMPLTADRDEFRNKFDPIINKHSITYHLLQIAEMEGSGNRDSLLQAHQKIQTEQRRYIAEFIRSHPGSYFALDIFERELLSKKSISPDTLAAIYACFDPAVKASDPGRSIAARLRLKQSLDLGKILPGFSFVTNSGQRYDLSSLRDEELLLVSFWASWCGPCRRSIPKLKKIADHNKGKGLILLSVSTDKNEDSWCRALSEEKMPWLQTCDLPKYTNGVSLQSLFDVAAIPQYFLMDKQGRLLYHSILSKDDDDYTVLKKLLGEKVPGQFLKQ